MKCPTCKATVDQGAKFCRQCGSSMFFRSERWAGELHIALGCINDEIDRKPRANVFFDRHVDWMPIDETLKQVEG